MRFFKVSLLCILSIVMLSFSSNAKSEVTTIHSSEDNCNIEWTLKKHVDDSYYIDVVLTNTGTTTIHNWAIGFILPNQVMNIWGGHISFKSKDYIIIKNDNYNQDINPGKSITIGMIIKGLDTVTPPNDFDLICNEELINEGRYDIRLQKINEWGGTLQYQLDIINKSDVCIEDWRLEFSSDMDVNIYDKKMEVVTREGVCSINNAGYNANIKPGSVVSFLFETNGEITSTFNLYEVCNNGESADLTIYKDIYVENDRLEAKETVESKATIYKLRVLDEKLYVTGMIDNEYFNVSGDIDNNAIINLDSHASLEVKSIFIKDDYIQITFLDENMNTMKVIDYYKLNSNRELFYNLLWFEELIQPELILTELPQTRALMPAKYYTYLRAFYVMGNKYSEWIRVMENRSLLEEAASINGTMFEHTLTLKSFGCDYISKDYKVMKALNYCSLYIGSAKIDLVSDTGCYFTGVQKRFTGTQSGKAFYIDYNFGLAFPKTIVNIDFKYDGAVREKPDEKNNGFINLTQYIDTNLNKTCREVAAVWRDDSMLKKRNDYFKTESHVKAMKDFVRKGNVTLKAKWSFYVYGNGICYGISVPAYRESCSVDCNVTYYYYK